jgi:hypothetical protein
MPRKEFGRATYRAYRLFGQVFLIATGQTPNWNDKVDFEQLPYRTFPPTWGLFFITPDVTMPAVRPFVNDEAIAYPYGIPTVSIEDADGLHVVPIAEVVPPGSAARSPPIPATTSASFSASAPAR